MEDVQSELRKPISHWYHNHGFTTAIISTAGESDPNRNEYLRVNDIESERSEYIKHFLYKILITSMSERNNFMEE